MRQLAMLILLGVALGIVAGGCGSAAQTSAAQEKVEALYVAMEAKWPVQHFQHIFDPACEPTVRDGNTGLYKCSLYPGRAHEGSYHRIESSWVVEPVASATEMHGVAHSKIRLRVGRTYGEEWKRVTGLNYVARYYVDPRQPPSPLPISSIAAVMGDRVIR